MLFCMGLSISRHHFRLFLSSLQNKHRCRPIFHFISEKCSIQQIKVLLLPFFPGQICSVTICVPLSCLNSVTTHTHTLTLGMHKNHNADAFFVRLYPFRVLPFFCNFLLILDDSHQKFDVEMRD